MKTILKPMNLFWLIAVIIFAIIFIYSDKDISLDSTSSHITKIHYADGITPTHLQLIEKFNKKYNGRIEVVPIDLPFNKFSTNERKELLARALRSKSEKIDLFAVDIVWGYRFAKWAENLTSYFSKEMLGTMIEPILPTCYYNDSLFAFPFTIDIATMYYRDDLLQNLPNYPEIKHKLENSITWEDFIQLGLKLNDSQKPFFSFPASDYEGLICGFTEMILNQDRNFFDNGKIDLTRPESVRALTTLTDLINKYNLTPKAVTAFTEHPCHRFYIDNNGYFVRSWPTFFSENYSTIDTAIRDDIKRIPTPHFRGTKPAVVYGGWNLVVSKFSEHKPEVLEFIRFLLSPESQQELFEGNGSLPVLKSVYENSDVEDAEVLNYYKKQIEFGVHRPLLEDYSRISDIISYYVHKALLQEIGVEEALFEATRMVNSNEVIFK